MKYLKTMGIISSSLLILIMTACGGNNNNPSNISSPTPTLILSPTTRDVVLGKSATFTVTATNTDFTVTGDGCTKNNSTTVVCTPTRVGTHELTVTATVDTTLTRKATITVIDVDIKLMSESGEEAVEVMVGESVTFTVTTTNTDFTMTAAAGSGCVSDGDVITCTPTVSGDYNLVVTATADTTKTAMAKITAYEVGISVAPSQEVIILGQSKTFAVTTLNTDFEMDVDSAAGCVASDNEITCTPTTTGTYELTVTAKKDTTKTATTVITVNEVGIAITPTTASVTVGNPVIFTISATNTGFDVTVDNEAAGCVTVDNDITCTPTTDGTYTLTVKATEDTTKTVTATITAVPAGPMEIEGMVFVKAWNDKDKAGTMFIMGCNVGEDGVTSSICPSMSRPKHEVTLTQDFYMGKYEVKQAQWLAVMGSLPPQDFPGDDMPVTGVSWDDITGEDGFLARLNAQEAAAGRRHIYRLPTEAEWEYAARGGVESKGYRWSGGNAAGSDTPESEEVGWFSYNSGGMPHIVGMRKPNELGIYDMSGNVSEWCNDFYNSYSAESQIDPTGPDNDQFGIGMARARRGGSWKDSTANGIVWYRSYSGAPYGSNDMGFRLVMTVE